VVRVHPAVPRQSIACAGCNSQDRVVRHLLADRGVWGYPEQHPTGDEPLADGAWVRVTRTHLRTVLVSAIKVPVHPFRKRCLGARGHPCFVSITAMC
jgi:hypothetical protein